MTKNRKKIIIHNALKRHQNDVKRGELKKNKRREEQKNGKTFFELLDESLSSPVRYLLEAEESPLSYQQILEFKDRSKSKIVLPECFSITENAKDTYNAIRELVSVLLFSKEKRIIIDYTKCVKFTLDAQVLLDIILKDILRFYAKLGQTERFKRHVKRLTDRSIGGSNIRKMLFSVGSQAVHANKQKEFSDVIPYNLCIHKSENNTIFQIEQKEIDTTSLADYVEECLGRMNRKLSSDAVDDLCTVIGEILINAEEHSSTHCRYSIGYFEEKNMNGKHFGMFQLVIMNMGKSIYEKFKDPECPNSAIVEKMRNLSDKYTTRKLWQMNKFDEETLWTLYSLQDGVTSVSPSEYKGRGNGSGRFIESFFNLKDINKDDNISKMTLQSGYTNIVFDGAYQTSERTIGRDTYKVMTFNKTGNIEDTPDTKYVKRVDYYFPGTFICANIII